MGLVNWMHCLEVIEHLLAFISLFMIIYKPMLKMSQRGCGIINLMNDQNFSPIIGKGSEWKEATAAEKANSI